MLHLRSIEIDRGLTQPKGFPFSLPVIAAWRKLEFETPVTILVGENGSGKSTVIEALAVAAEMITVGSQSVARDKTLAEVQPLAESFKLIWNRRTRRGFFLRAEDFFGYVKEQAKTRLEMQRELKAVDAEYQGRSTLAKNLAKMPYAGELSSMQRKYGKDLEAYSHGESFLALFQARFVPEGLYLLDEPEIPLSPLRQLTLLSLFKQMVEEGGQFVVATHSPILMAFPGAQILSFDSAPIKPVRYEELEHVNLTRDFLNNPEQFLHHL